MSGFDVNALVLEQQQKQEEMAKRAAEAQGRNTRIWWQKPSGKNNGTTGVTYFAVMPIRPIEVKKYFRNNLTERPSTGYLVVAKILKTELDGQIQDISDFDDSYALIDLGPTVYNQWLDVVKRSLLGVEEDEFNDAIPPKQIQVLPDADEVYPMMLSKSIVGSANGKNTYSYDVSVMKRALTDTTLNEIREFIDENPFDEEAAVKNVNTFGIYLPDTDISALLENTDVDKIVDDITNESGTLDDEPNF